MLLFSTILSIKDSLTKDVFIRAAIDWNQESPYEENVIPDIEWHGERNIRFGDDRRWMQIEEYRNEDIIAIRYENCADDGVVWDADFVMNYNEKKMSVRLYRSYLEDASMVNINFSTPVFIDTLIEKGFVEDDGDLPVDLKPVYIDNKNDQIMEQLVSGEAKYQLPVVYVSKTYSNEDPVDVSEMASRLKGIAHVLVQKKSKMGDSFRNLIDKKREYNGAIGIYLPNQTVSHRKFLNHGYPGSEEKLAKKVIEYILWYSTSQRVDSLYTWQGVTNSLLRDRYSSKREELAIKISEIKEHQEWQEVVEEEMESMSEQIKDLIRQNDALTSENMGLRAQMRDMGSQSPILYLGGEDEFFPGEIREYILLALENEKKRTKPQTRKSDVLGDLIRSNGGVQGLAKERSRKLKSILKGYKNLSAKQKRDLEDLGFTIVQESGHYKLLYYNDKRYMATLASTPSDSKAGENNAQELIRDMF